MASSLLFCISIYTGTKNRYEIGRKKETDIDGKKCVDGRIEKTI